MKITFNSLLSIALLFTAVLTISCKDSATETTSESNGTNSTYRSAIFLEAREFEAGMKKNKGVILDVRMPQEFEEGHIEGALNVNFFDPTFKSQLLQLDKDKKYYVYCKNDTRSQRAAEFMMSNDFPDVYVLKGGYEEFEGK